LRKLKYFSMEASICTAEQCGARCHRKGPGGGLMPFKDVTTIFSRAFILGFYLPAFFALTVLWQTLPMGLLPVEFKHYTAAVQLLIIASLGIPLGLLLSGLNYSILRLYEGYPLQQAQHWHGIRFLYKRLMQSRINEFNDLTSRKQAGDSTAAWQLDRRYPSIKSHILPTRFGNAVRAFEHHALVRWGLSTVGVWPRIELLLSQDESQTLATVKSDADFLVNASLLSYGVGIVLVVSVATHTAAQWYSWLLCIIPFIVGYLLYRIAVGAAVRWGSGVRSCVDLHRLQLYERMGVQQPRTRAHEAEIADAINQCLLYGVPIPDTVRAVSAVVQSDLQNRSNGRYQGWRRRATRLTTHKGGAP